MSRYRGSEQAVVVDSPAQSTSIGTMLYEITIWQRTVSAPLLLARRHELGRLAQVKELAKAMLRDVPDGNALHYVRVAEAHNGREAFVCRFDQLI